MVLHVAHSKILIVTTFSSGAVRNQSRISSTSFFAANCSGDPVSKETFAAMGNSPIVLSITDVTTALNTNMIDTVYGPPLGVLALQWYSYVKYMTALPIAHSTGAVLISKTFFDSMPDKLALLLKEEFNHTLTQLASELKKQSQE